MDKALWTIRHVEHLPWLLSSTQLWILFSDCKAVDTKSYNFAGTRISYSEILQSNISSIISKKYSDMFQIS